MKICLVTAGLTLLATTSALAAQVDLSQSPCLQPPAQVSPVTGPGSVVVRGGDGQTYDARDQAFSGMGVGVIEVDNPTANTCVVGPTIVGPIGDDVSWRSSIKPDGIQHSRGKGPYRVHGASIRNVTDALSPPKATDISREVTFSYRDIYARAIRDDLLENDACLGGEIVDSLFDGVHMGISQRPSSGTEILNLGPTMPVVTIRNTMIRLQCQTDVRDENKGSCPANQSHAEWWKLSTKCKTTDGRIGPHYVLENLIFRADHSSRNGVDVMRFPPPDQVTAKNVTVLYTGPDPEHLPAMPPGVTVVTERATADRIWNDARAKWLKEHGCDPNGDHCAYLTTSMQPDLSWITERTEQISKQLDEALGALLDARDQLLESIKAVGKARQQLDALDEELGGGD